ncbi:MAG TPA: hypothetical protein VGI39_20090, partial [Polyangiaceae bacterium]
RYASAADFASAMQAVLAGATKLPASIAPIAPPPPPPPPPTPSSPRPGAAGPPRAAPVQTPPGTTPALRSDISTRPDRHKEAAAAAQIAGTPIGLLVGVAAACLLLGVLLTVVYIRFIH